MCAVSAAASDDAVPSKSTPASRFLVMDVLDQLIDDTDVNAPLSADWYLAVTPPPTSRRLQQATQQAIAAGDVKGDTASRIARQKGHQCKSERKKY
jgi:hypothetical protein